MAIINTEEWAFRPVLNFLLFTLRFHDIKYDSNSIFIIIPDDALVCIGPVSWDHAIFFRRELSRFIVLEQETVLVNEGQLLA